MSLIQTAASLIRFKHQNSSKIKELHGATFVPVIWWSPGRCFGMRFVRLEPAELFCVIPLGVEIDPCHPFVSEWHQQCHVMMYLLSLSISPTPSVTGGRSCWAILTWFHEFRDAFTKSEAQNTIAVVELNIWERGRAMHRGFCCSLLLLPWFPWASSLSWQGGAANPLIFKSKFYAMRTSSPAWEQSFARGSQTQLVNRTSWWRGLWGREEQPRGRNILSVLFKSGQMRHFHGQGHHQIWS